MKKMSPKYLNGYIADNKHSTLDAPGWGGEGGYSKMWARLRYEPTESPWVLKTLILQKNVIFALVGIAFMV